MADRPAPAPARALTITGPASTPLDRIVDRVQASLPALTRTSDVLLVVATALLAAADAVIWATDPVQVDGRFPFSPAFVVPILGVAAVGAVAARHRRRVATVSLATACLVVTAVTAAAGASLPPSLAAVFALAVLTVGVLRHEPRRALWLGALAGLGIAAEAVRPLVEDATYLLVAGEAAFAAAVGVGIYLRWSDWRRTVAAETARTHERLEIARELHDLVGHHLTGIVVQAQAARWVSTSRPEAATEALVNVEVAGTEALATMRRLVGSLRDDAPVSVGTGWVDVARLIEDAARAGQPVQLRTGTNWDELPESLAPSAHRIVAEALTNVRRHGRGVTAVDVVVDLVTDVNRCDPAIVVTVTDDGRAAEHGDFSGYGIIGMRERAGALGGTLSAGPRPTGGWQVRAILPVEEHG